ncbi:type IX secretion system protein PorD [Pontibacter sp. H249]|uniref:type IX secretion system protein PorD n=1 Tax=Pontibacter sp. H249 TaxID=3133420 RepID=UPI0030C63C18
MVKKILALLMFCLTAWTANAQELQCDVVVNSEQVQYTDRQLFTDMQTRIFEFMNNRRWTEQAYRPDERIKCRLLINLTEMPEIGIFKANVQVVSVRPAYGTGYESTLFSFIDKDWTFQFNTAQPLDFAENSYTSNLSSMLAFYAYMIIGIDNDSFGRLGGAPAFDKARGIVNLAASQGAGYQGWKAFDSNRNRYWLIDNMQDPQFLPFREGLYNMHRQGLDIMVENPEKARQSVITVLESVQRLQQQKPNSAVVRSFFDAKADELVNMFKNAAPAQKQQAYTLLSQTDPTNNTKYEVLLKR